MVSLLCGCTAGRAPLTPPPIPNAPAPPPKPAKSGAKSLGNIVLAWKPSPSNGVSHYEMLSGFAPRTYSITNVTVGPVTNMTLKANSVPTYYTVVAVSSYGDMSDFSNEVVWPEPRTNVVIQQWSSNMVNWVEVRRDTNTAIGDAGFWRLKIE